jgi:hypothetical protein
MLQARIFDDCMVANVEPDDFLCVDGSANVRASKNNGDGTFTYLGSVRLIVTRFIDPPFC